MKLGDGTLANLADKFEKRMITVVYRSVSLEVEVMDFREEIEVKVSALLKQMSVGLLNGIPAMAYEDAFWGEVELVDCKVEFGLLKPFIAARQVANALLVAGDYERRADMLSALQAKLAVFVQLDRTFVMEVALTKSTCSDGGTKRLQHLTLDLLPTADKRATPADVSSSMAEMQRDKLYSMMNDESRHVFDACKEMVNYIERGLPVKILDCEASDFVKTFRSRPDLAIGGPSAEHTHTPKHARSFTSVCALFRCSVLEKRKSTMECGCSRGLEFACYYRPALVPSTPDNIPLRLDVVVVCFGGGLSFCTAFGFLFGPSQILQLCTQASA